MIGPGEPAQVVPGRAAAALLAAAALVGAPAARAEPQLNVGVQPAVAGTAVGGGWWQQTAFFGAVRADLLLGRERDVDWGAGPFVDVASVAFDDVRAGAGGSLLVPVSRQLPLILSGGGYARHAASGWEPGVAGWVFWGVRGHNFHGTYGAAAGLCVGLQQGLGADGQRALVVGAHLDALLLALPFVAGYEWLAH